MSRFFRLPQYDAAAPWLVFAPEWLGVALLVPLDALLASWAGFRFSLDLHDANMIAMPLLAAAIALRKFGGQRGGVMLEFFALMLAAGPLLTVMTYVGLAQSGSFWDARFLLADRALGFDWLGWFHFVTRHGAVAAVLSFLYVSLTYQAVYFTLLMGLMSAAGRMKEIFWLLLFALVLTALFCWLMPAMGPYQTFALQSYGPFLPEIARLHASHGLAISLAQLQGVVTFPSFHTTMALAMIYAFRRTGIIGWGIALANGVLLLGVPVYGGHYLVDMIAGTGVFVLALAAVRLAARLKLRKPAPGIAMVAA